METNKISFLFFFYHGNSVPKVQPLLNVVGRWQRVVPELCRRELRFLVEPPKADWSGTQQY